MLCYAAILCYAAEVPFSSSNSALQNAQVQMSISQKAEQLQNFRATPTATPARWQASPSRPERVCFSTEPWQSLIVICSRWSADVIPSMSFLINVVSAAACFKMVFHCQQVHESNVRACVFRAFLQCVTKAYKQHLNPEDSAWTRHKQRVKGGVMYGTLNPRAKLHRPSWPPWHQGRERKR